MRRHRGTLLALAATAAALTVQYQLHREAIERYDQQVLPAFDAYVYMAMADHPSVFTVAPWGYRILTPWIVHALPLARADGFRCVTFGALGASGVLLFLFLRRLGNGEWASLLAVLAFALSEPVGQAVSYVFLSDPLSVLLEIALLLALETGAPAAVLALVVAVGVVNKEVFLLFLPVVYLALRDREGDRRAAGKAAVGLLAGFLTRAVLLSWAPQLPSSVILIGPDVFWRAVYRILAGWHDWWRSALLAGLLPLACVGTSLRDARPFLRRYGYMAVLTLVLPFATAVRNDDIRQIPFMAQDIPRVLLLALPLLLPLVLLALHRALPHIGEPTPPPAFPRRLRAAAAVATGALVAAPLLVFDHYRRLDLRGPHDGRLVLAFCRESLAFAQRLERGKPVPYDPEGRRFAPRRSEPHLLERMRWFLRDGWGPMPHYGMGPVVMAEREATVILPCFRPADWDAVVSLSAPRSTRLRVEVNGRAVGDADVGPEPSRHALRVPAALLFRGDNLLRLVAAGDADPQARLHAFTIRPVA